MSRAKLVTSQAARDLINEKVSKKGLRQKVNTKKDDSRALIERMNNLRDPANEWQALARAVIQSVMDDFIQLQHPLRRDHGYLREAFQLALAALYDNDYTIEWPIGKNGEIQKLSFKELLYARYGLDSISKTEMMKLDMIPFRDQVIEDAKKYWLDRVLEAFDIPHFFTFKGMAYTIWMVPNDEPSEIDNANAVIYLSKRDEIKEQQLEFMNIVIKVINKHDNIGLSNDAISILSESLWEMLRMNGSFRAKM